MSAFAQIAATPIGDVAARSPAVVTPDTPLANVASQMREGHGGAVLVMENDELLGIFTERDLMKRVDHRNPAWVDTPVREVMTANPHTIDATETIEDAINRMTVGGYRRMPVLDRAGKPVALLSIRDILACMVEFYPQEFVNLPPDPNHETTGRWGG